MGAIGLWHVLASPVVAFVVMFLAWAPLLSKRTNPDTIHMLNTVGAVLLVPASLAALATNHLSTSYWLGISAIAMASASLMLSSLSSLRVRDPNSGPHYAKMIAIGVTPVAFVALSVMGRSAAATASLCPIAAFALIHHGEFSKSRPRRRVVVDTNGYIAA